MIDSTAFSVLGFLIAKIVFAIAGLAHVWLIGKRIWTHADAVEGSFVTKWESAVRANFLRTILSIVVLVTITYALTAEGPYRPKSTIAPPPDSTSDERTVPEFRSEPRKPTWDEVQRRNAEENDKARQEFEAVPAKEK